MLGLDSMTPDGIAFHAENQRPHHRASTAINFSNVGFVKIGKAHEHVHSCRAYACSQSLVCSDHDLCLPSASGSPS